MRTMLKPLCLALLLAPGVGLADTLVMEKVRSDQQAAGARPSRGMSQQVVLTRFGEPQSRLPAVGEPPISRWVYADHTVYFERDRVLHTVVRR